MVDPALLEVLLQDAELEGDQEKLNRVLALADELRQQGQEDITGMMSGRIYVPPSHTQGLAQMARAGLGAYQEYRGDQLRKRQAADRGAMRQQYLTALLRGQGGGRPSSIAPAPAPGMGAPPATTSPWINYRPLNTPRPL